MLGMFGIRIMSGNQLLNGYANGITPNVFGLGEVAEPKSQIEVQMFKMKNEC